MSGATSGDWKRRHDGGLRHRQMLVNGHSPPVNGHRASRRLHSEGWFVVVRGDPL
jgi:hypothetical protein